MKNKFYEFYNPVKIISGDRAIENIPYELQQINAKNPLIITEANIFNIGLVDITIECLKNSNIEVKTIYKDVPPDSSNIVVNNIAEIYNKNNCDSIIALGGGSVIDTAKGVNIVITENSNSLLDFMGSEILKKDMKPLIVIPTTAGTGSEATMAAVIANPEKNVKMTFNSYTLIPTIAVLDPQMTITLPPKLTAATGMDALTHAIEAFSCIQKNPLSDTFATSAIKLITENLVHAIIDGKDKNARLNMANASIMSGIAFSNSMVGIVHSIGHALGGVAHIPHGIAMSILLPFCMEYNLDMAKENYADLLFFFSQDEYCNTLPDERGLKTIKMIKNLTFKLNELSSLPITLKEVGINREQFDTIAKTAMNDGSLVYNMKKASYADIINILEKAYE